METKLFKLQILLIILACHIMEKETMIKQLNIFKKHLIFILKEMENLANKHR